MVATTGNQMVEQKVGLKVGDLAVPSEILKVVKSGDNLVVNWARYLADKMAELLVDSTAELKAAMKVGYLAA